MGKFVDEKLEKLGAERVFKLGEGDDDAKYVVRPHPLLIICLVVLKKTL